MSLITIKQSHEVSDLLVLKSRLEFEGINCQLKNEYTAQIMNYMANFMVELQVSDTDLDKVQKVLDSAENIES